MLDILNSNNGKGSAPDMVMCMQTNEANEHSSTVQPTCLPPTHEAA